MLRFTIAAWCTVHYVVTGGIVTNHDSETKQQWSDIVIDLAPWGRPSKLITCLPFYQQLYSFIPGWPYYQKINLYNFREKNQMGHVALDFVKTYYKSILLFITPIIFSPLLTLNELETIPNDELFDIYRTKGETMNETLTRLNENPPTLYKVWFSVMTI